MRLFNKNHFALWIWTAAVLLPGSSSRGLEAQQLSVPPEVLAYADIVLYNGQVLTVDDDFTIAEAVAIRDGKFLALGSDQRIRALAGPNTRQIDLQGKSVVPGFIDTHNHYNGYAERGPDTPSDFSRSRSVGSGYQGAGGCRTTRGMGHPQVR